MLFYLRLSATCTEERSHRTISKVLCVSWTIEPVRYHQTPVFTWLAPPLPSLPLPARTPKLKSADPFNRKRSTVVVAFPFSHCHKKKKGADTCPNEVIRGICFANLTGWSLFYSAGDESTFTCSNARKRHLLPALPRALVRRASDSTLKQDNSQIRSCTRSIRLRNLRSVQFRPGLSSRLES